MQWSGWDIAIVLATLLQLALLAAVALNLVRLARTGGKLARRGTALARKGSALVGTLSALVPQGRKPLLGIMSQIALTRAHLSRLTDRTHTEHLPINWFRILAAYGTLRTVRGYLDHAQAFLARIRKQPAPVAKTAKPKRPARLPLLERAGLVPPLWLRLRRYTPYVRTVLEVRNELKRRGIL